MPRPAVPTVSETWNTELAVSQPGDEARGWPFLIFLGGLGAAFGEVHDLVRDTDAGPGWSALLDPARCPAWALPWLAQFAGVKLTPGLSEAEQREQITSPPAFNRGTLDATVAAAQRRLTGGRRVMFIERDGSAWRDLLVTYAAETPDPAATLRDVLAQEVVGRKLVYRTDLGWDIDEMEADQPNLDLLEATYPDLDMLEQHVLGFPLESWIAEPVPYGSFGAREDRAYRRRM